MLTPTFRYNPAVIAQAFATMACLYPGRVMLGVGTGEALNEIAVSGLEWPEFKERFARLREAVRLMRAAVDRGRRRPSRASTTRPSTRPSTTGREQPVPVYIAAGGPVVAKYAGRAGDGFICTSGKGMELYTEKLIPAVAEGAAKAGRDAAAIDRMIEIKLSYDRDPGRGAGEQPVLGAAVADRRSRSTACDSAARWSGWPTSCRSSRSRSAGSSPPTPTRRSAQIQPYVDAGFNHLVFHGPGHDQERFLTQFAADVLPKLRALG